MRGWCGNVRAAEIVKDSLGCAARYPNSSPNVSHGDISVEPKGHGRQAMRGTSLSGGAFMPGVWQEIPEGRLRFSCWTAGLPCSSFFYSFVLAGVYAAWRGVLVRAHPGNNLQKLARSKPLGAKDSRAAAAKLLAGRAQDTAPFARIDCGSLAKPVAEVKGVASEGKGRPAGVPPLAVDS